MLKRPQQGEGQSWRASASMTDFSEALPSVRGEGRHRSLPENPVGFSKNEEWRLPVPMRGTPSP